MHGIKTLRCIAEGPVEEFSLEEITSAMKKMKLEKASGLIEVSMEMINANGKVGIDVMMKLCQRILDRKGMPEDWKTSVMVSIDKGKRDVTNCGAYRGVKLLEHRMKIVEKVLEKRIRTMVEVDDMQFDFIPGRGTTDGLFIVRRMQEEYRKKDEKLYKCFVNLEKAFDRVSRRLIQLQLRKKEQPKILVKAVMSMYEVSKTKIKLDLNSQKNFISENCFFTFVVSNYGGCCDREC